MSDVEYSEGDEDMNMDTAPVVDNRKHARAQHNALERRRRDNIKDMYGALKETIPGMGGERASRAVILKRAVDRIQELQTTLKNMEAGKAELERASAEIELELARLQGRSKVTPTTTSEEENRRA